MIEFLENKKIRKVCFLLKIFNEEFQEKIKITAFFFLLYLVAFGLMMFSHFSPDTFNNFTHSGYKMHLVCGRVASYIVNSLFFKIDAYRMSWLTSLIGIIFLTISSFIIYSKISRLLEKESFIIAGIISILFCNTFMTDVFQFSEACPTIIFSVLFSSFALIPIKREMPLKNFLLSTLLLIISLNFYQAALGYYVTLSLILIYFYYDGKLTWGG